MNENRERPSEMAIANAQRLPIRNVKLRLLAVSGEQKKYRIVPNLISGEVSDKASHPDHFPIFARRRMLLTRGLRFIKNASRRFAAATHAQKTTNKDAGLAAISSCLQTCVQRTFSE